MCWSATADLVAGTGVVGIGGVGIALARQARDVPLAALPVLLGTHQLVEARIWQLSSGEGAEIRGPAVFTWTLIAFVLLPLIVPVVLLVAERRRRPVQWAAAAVGVAVAAVMVAAVLGGTKAVDHGHLMSYGAGVPLVPLVLTGYLIATCVPFLTSREPTMRELGVALTVGAGLAAALSLFAFASIFCAYAAVVSVLVVRRTLHARRHLAPPAL